MGAEFANILRCRAAYLFDITLQDRDAIVKGLKNQIKNTITMSQGNPQAKIMEPLLNQPTSSFEFAFKIRVSSAQRGRCSWCCAVLVCTLQGLCM
jgi:hypothetical protein